MLEHRSGPEWRRSQVESAGWVRTVAEAPGEGVGARASGRIQ